MQDSPPSHPPWPPHSTEVEHRLTIGEKDLEQIRYRMSLHERAIIFIFGLLYILLQDKFPELARLIKQAIP